MEVCGKEMNKDLITEKKRNRKEQWRKTNEHKMRPNKPIQKKNVFYLFGFRARVHYYIHGKK